MTRITHVIGWDPAESILSFASLIEFIRFNLSFIVLVSVTSLCRRLIAPAAGSVTARAEPND